MNRRLLTAVALSFLTVFALQYFTAKKPAPGATDASGKIQAGQFYTAPVQQCWHKEPNREIDFLDEELKKTPDGEETLTIHTPLTTINFSSFGGIIQSLSFKEHKGKDGKPLTTVGSNPLEEREEGCFLLAFEEKTPYQYQLVSRVRRDDVQEIIYQTKVQDWLVKKAYRIYDNSYRVDLLVSFEPSRKDAKPLSPRLFYPSPYVPEVPNNMINGVVTRDGKSVEKVAQGKELTGVWGLPEIFGSEDKYFAHTLAKDPGNFAQGGYYKKVNKKLFAIVEGPEVKEKKSWNLSFYFGPKLLQSLSAVDERLEDLLSFGWLSWLCKILLRLLEYLYKHLGNFGLAIIILTILLKLPFLPLTISSRRKMEEYQKFQPTLNRIRMKYKHDLKRQQEEVMRFHQEHNLSPTTPMVGCLPLLIQMPILFALYRVLNNYVSLYHAPLFGWLQDLSASDPYYVLPILMGLTMILQQQMSPVSDDKQRMMMLFMPIVMTAVFINFPAGLVLYWFMNNLLTVGEDVLRKKVLR